MVGNLRTLAGPLVALMLGTSAVAEVGDAMLDPPIGSGDVLDIWLMGYPELSRAYRVRADGTISMHLIGAIPVEGLTPEAVRSDLEERLDPVIQGTVSVAVEVEAYRPVMVTGDVESPGAYSFSPGLDVQEAVALAGGVRREADESAGTAMQVQMQIGEQSRLLTELASLLAERARLIAERDGTEEIALDAEIEELAGTQTAADMRADQEQLLSSRRDQLQGDVAAQHEAADLARREAESYASQEEAIQRQLEASQANLDELEELRSRGLATSDSLLSLRLSVDQFRSDALGAVAARTQATRDAEQADAAAEDTVRQRDRDVRAELVRVEAAILEHRARLKGVDTFVRRFGPAESLVANGLATITYSLVHGQGGARSEVVATEWTQLMPGDVVKVLIELPVVRAGSANRKSTSGSPNPDE